MKKRVCALAMAAAVLFTGCSTDVPDLSNVDNDLAAQYVAGVLLKYDKDYEGALDYDHSLLTATPTPEPTVAPTEAPDAATSAASDGTDTGASGTDAGAGVTYTSVSLTDIYGVSGVTVKANSYQLKGSYGTSYASYTAKDGNRLLVVHFTISNNTKSAKKVNLSKQAVTAELYVNGVSQGTALNSIVDGDLQYFNETIAAGKKKQGVLLFEISKDLKVDSVTVHFAKGSEEAEVSVH